jgi:2,5-diamino-6-(ribosylamino)-4(3H)-pyrimidinone 5'-phosphate reductase
MLYPKLKFFKHPQRPTFYTNFVATVDGKVSISKDGYWPIGSKKDYETLIELRTYADCLIHGGELARKFGDITVKSINKKIFQQARKIKGKSANLPYYVVTKHPKSLSILKDSATIFSHDLKELVKVLKDKGYKDILVEGGPTLLGSFLSAELIDEIFLTIAPKIYGSKPFLSKTLIEGILLPQNKFKLKLISVKTIKNELFLRYQVRS